MGTGQRPPWQPITLVVVLTVAVLAGGVYASRHLGSRSTGGHTTAGRPPAAGTPSAAASGAVPGPSGSAPPAGTPQLSFSFDNGLVGPGLAVRTAEDGKLALEPHNGGSAVRFPPPCANYGAPECPRAVLEASGGVPLSPGSGDLSWGASVLLEPDETTKGSNLVQKGFSTGGGEFKLQVDGHEGLPTCVLADSGADAPLYIAKSSVTIADSRWHAVRCTRTGTLLTVAVDGTEVGRVIVPTGLSVINDNPVVIGGKGTTPNNDQYHGAIDDVFITIDS